MNLLVLDFETFFDRDYSLRLLTPAEYIMDPRFRVHGLAIRYPDGREEFRTDVPAALASLQAQYGTGLERVVPVVHNGHFDLAVLAWYYGVHVSTAVDTLQLAHAVLGRRGEGGSSATLKDLALRFGLEPKGTLDEFLGVYQLDALQTARMARYACHDAELTAQIALRLLRQVSRPEVELRIAAHTLRLHHERGFRVDVAAIDPLIAEVRRDTEAWFAQAAVTPQQVRSGKQFATLLAQALAQTGRALPMKPGKNGPIPAVAKKDQAMIALVDDADPVVQELAQIRLDVGRNTQLQSRLERLKKVAVARSGVLPVHLVFHGAGTGRFSGGGKINVQNFPKHGIGVRMRGLLMAPPGQHLVIADLAQIECRIVAHVAGEAGLLDAFRHHRDPYAEEASAIFGEPVHKPNASTPPAAAPRLTALRETGKQAVLGLGFGMGGLKFHGTLLGIPTTAALFASGELSPARCQQIVKSFRERFAGIPALWGALEDAARGSCAARTSETVAGVGIGPDPAEPGMIITLPSTRTLRYPRARLVAPTRPITYLDDQGQPAEFMPTEEALVYGTDKKPMALYGGKLLENVVQAIARDILVEAILRIEARGIAILAHVHDEIIATAPTDQAAAAQAIVVEEMTRAVPWLPGLPLDVEAHVSERYTK